MDDLGGGGEGALHRELSCARAGAARPCSRRARRALHPSLPPPQVVPSIAIAFVTYEQARSAVLELATGTALSRLGLRSRGKPQHCTAPCFSSPCPDRPPSPLASPHSNAGQGGARRRDPAVRLRQAGRQQQGAPPRQPLAQISSPSSPRLVSAPLHTPAPPRRAAPSLVRPPSAALAARPGSLAAGGLFFAAAPQYPPPIGA